MQLFLSFPAFFERILVFPNKFSYLQMKFIFLKCIFVPKSACRLLFFPLVFHTAFEIIYEHATQKNKKCQRQYDSKRSVKEKA